MLKKILMALTICGLTFSGTGCEGLNPLGPLITIGIAWMNGEASKYYNVEQPLIHEALKQVLVDLEFTITDEYVHGDTIYIIADAGDRFKIKVERVRDNITNLRIRVNIMGDKPYAELIYEKVDAYRGVKTFESEKQLRSALYE